MPPKKVIEPGFVPVVEETEIERLENRIAVLEGIVSKLYKSHYNPIYG